MGEYAEMMLDGTCCEGCGEYMGEATGFPGYCSRQCARDRGVDDRYEPRVPRFDRNAVKPSPTPTAEKLAKQGRAACDVCGKVVKAAGLRDHKRDVHGVGL